jgi:hypothetical protein
LIPDIDRKIFPNLTKYARTTTRRIGYRLTDYKWNKERAGI